MEMSDLKALENYWKDYRYHKNEVQLLEKACTEKELTQNKRYKRLVEIVEAVESVLKDAKPELKRFAEVRYLSEEALFRDWADVSDELGMPRAKCYKLRVNLLAKTAEEFGYVQRPIRL